MKLVLTCEHAGNHIPEKFKHLFKNQFKILKTHRGYDPGALDLFRSLEDLAQFTKFQDVSRLLIEMNRSLHHPSLFSEFTGKLPIATKKEIINEYYIPYRTEVQNAISAFTEKGAEVIHLSIHSFSPQLNGNIRNADIGLLYDPTRKSEKDFCTMFKKELQIRDNSLKIRYNYPYRGTADGFTTSLRKTIPNYRGIEIEVNQKFVDDNKMDLKIRKLIFTSLETLMRR